jgi:hypothetical protein
MWLVLTVMVLAMQTPAHACAACYGASDSPMANGFNWGIISLLGVVVGVLGSITAFFVFIGKKSAAFAAAAAAEAPTSGSAQTPLPTIEEA